MKLKHLFIANFVISLVNGASFLLAPTLYLSLYGVTRPNQATILIAQLLGAGLLNYSLVAWFARNAKDSDARRAIVLGFFITFTIGFVVFLWSQLFGIVNALGWIAVGLYFMLALGYGYSLFIHPDATY